MLTSSEVGEEKAFGVMKQDGLSCMRFFPSIHISCLCLIIHFSYFIFDTRLQSSAIGLRYCPRR